MTLLEVNGQEINPTYFLLGTLHDYMEREYPIKNPAEAGYIMTLHQEKIGEIRRIEEIIDENFERREQDNCTNCHEFFELKSKSLEEKINSFYSFKRNKEMTDELDFEYYTGKLKCRKILNASKLELKSFIAGQFLTSGDKVGDNYRIILCNSPTRYKCLKKVLKALDCNIIRAEVRDGGVPWVYVLEFRATSDVTKIIENEMELRNTLANKKHSAFGN